MISKQTVAHDGRLKLRELVFDLPPGMVACKVKVLLGNQPVTVKSSVSGTVLRLSAGETMPLQAGETLEVEIR